MSHLHDSALQMYKQPPFGGIDKLSILELLYEAALLFEEADVLPKVSSLDQDNPFLHGTVPLTKLGPDPQQSVKNILHEYKIHNANILFREDCTGVLVLVLF